MPIPTPSAGQTKDGFLTSCMADPTMTSEYPDTPQRYAVCLAQWTNRSEPAPVSDGWPVSPFAPTEGL